MMIKIFCFMIFLANSYIFSSESFLLQYTLRDGSKVTNCPYNVLQRLKEINNEYQLWFIYIICKNNKDCIWGVNIVNEYKDYLYLFQDARLTDGGYLIKDTIKSILNCIEFKRIGCCKKKIILKDPITGEDV